MPETATGTSPALAPQGKRREIESTWEAFAACHEYQDFLHHTGAAFPGVGDEAIKALAWQAWQEKQQVVS